jgi:hypothetical protein
MKIFWYDRGYFHQSFGLPYLPYEHETLMAYSPGVKHAAPNVIGCENWRVPVLHRLRMDQHEIVWGSKRDIMPSEDIDFDMARLADDWANLSEFTYDRDPMLGTEVWDVHTPLEKEYLERFPPGRAKESGRRGVDPGDENYTLKWLGERIDSDHWGTPPPVDVAIIAIVRGNVIAGFEQTYAIRQYLKQGTPVILYDQDRQLAATVNSLTKTGLTWPDPGILVIAPYTVSTQWGEAETIDFPYIEMYADWWDRFGETWDKRGGAGYVGNDYDRRKLMEKYLLPLTKEMPVNVWGKFDSKDAEVWKAEWPEVNWAGRVETVRALSRINECKLTVNLIKQNYTKLGQITMRTMESAMAGVLQIGIAENIRMTDFVPRPYIAASTTDALRIAREVASMGQSAYKEELEMQREILRKYELNTYYMPRLYELIEKAQSLVAA